MNTEERKNATAETQSDKHQAEDWNRLSVALHILLPVAGLALFLRQKHILSRLLLQLDRNCVSVLCPSFSKREKLLKWIGSRLPETWSSQSKTLSGGITDLWTDGSLLCTLINTAIPGACLNPHRHWKKTPVHAQAIAYKYLGVIPVFTDSDLAGKLDTALERSFLSYLNELKRAIIKFTERNELSKSISGQFIVRGMGLYTGEQHRKTIFYVYPNNTCTFTNNSNIIIHIRGPYGTYGKGIIPKFHNDLFPTKANVVESLLKNKNMLQSDFSKTNNVFIKNFSLLPFMHYHKKHMGDNIVIHVTMEDERAKITYIPKNYGMYEIILVSNGELIRGCPFNVHILHNTSGVEETLEIEEKEEIIPHARKRKIISKTIDFIDEQMPLSEIQNRYHIKEAKNEIKKFRSDNNNGESITNGGQFDIEEPNDDMNFKVNAGVPSIAEKDDELCLQETFDEIDTSKPNKSNLPDDQCILEKQNFESVNESKGCKLGRNESKMTNPIFIETKHDDTYNEINDTDAESIDSGVSSVTTPRSCVKLTFNEYPKPIVVNKIQIPEKFTDLRKFPQDEPEYNINSKHYKDVVNRSNEQETPTNFLKYTILQDDLKRTRKTIQSYHGFGVVKPSTETNGNLYNKLEDKKIIKRICRDNSVMSEGSINTTPQRIFQRQVNNKNFRSSSPIVEHESHTSPICFKHIEPEVSREPKQLSLSKKRKIFAGQFTKTVSNFGTQSHNDVDLSDDSSMENTTHTDTETPDYDGYSTLYSTKSLPNIPSVEDDHCDFVTQNSVKERKHFWEQLSASSASLSKAEHVRLKRIWSKPLEVTDRFTNTKLPVEKDIFKSADDIRSITNALSYKNSKKYKSVDDSLDTCCVLSIDERKKMLLKQNCDNGIAREYRQKTLKINKAEKVDERVTEIREQGGKVQDNLFSPIREKIRKFNSSSNIINDPEADKSKVVSNNVKTINEKREVSKEYAQTDFPKDLPKVEKTAIKSHFNKAIRYFKSLEEKSCEKNKSKLGEKDCCRKYLLDIFPRRPRNGRRGGSLSLPRVSDRFSIDYIYKDVLGNKRGVFKGAPNRSAVVEALATFSRKEDENIVQDNEENIKYDIFKKRAKIRKRKSLRSIFDVYY